VKTLSPPLAKPRSAKAIVTRRTPRPDGIRAGAIGGGTGLSTLLRGFRRYVVSPHQDSADCEDAPCVISDLAAVVTVTDDGGSSGRLGPGVNIGPPRRPRHGMVGRS